MSDHSATGMSALTGALVGLSVVSTGLRFCARHKTKAKFMVDDWLMLLALVTFIGVSAVILRLVHIKAFGYSSFQFTSAEKTARYDQSTKLQTSLVALSIACLACVKASALFFYKRIFCVRGQRWGLLNIILVGSIVVVTCWFVIFLFLDIFQCQGHFSGLADVKLYKQYCQITWRFLYAFSISDVLLDVLVLILPVPSILRLRITLPKKLSVLAIFMVACVALAASIVRMVIYIRLFILGLDEFNHLDSEQIVTQYAFYYILECGCAILAINLPSIWPLFSGRGLESIMKLARSVTSLTSRSSRSTRSTEASTCQNQLAAGVDSHYVSVATPHDEKSGHLVTMEGHPTSDGSVSSRFEILRQDSVQISSEARMPDDIHRREEGW